MTKMPDGLQPPKQITKAERDARKAFRQVDAKKAMTEHEIAQSGHDTNLYKNNRTAARFLANERRLHPAIHRPGSAHPDGKGSQLAHDQNRPDNVFGLDARGCFETGAQSCATARHQCVRVYAAAKERVRLKLPLILPANVRCSLPCEVCRNRFGHPFSASRA